MAAINEIVRRKKATNTRFERQIVTGMIISTEFLKGIEPIYQEKCLKVPFAQIIARWCLEYFQQYKVAPNNYIEDIFRIKKNDLLDPDEVNMIESFLEDVSSEYVEREKNNTFNAEYILDKAENYFRELSLRNLTDEIRKALIGNRIEEAEALIKGYTRVTRVQTRGVDPVFDKDTIVSALSDEAGDRLFSLPGVLGKTIGVFERGWLFSFVGSSGTGKSWWLMISALRALFSGFNVVFISMEMSEKQMTRRIHHWINGKPTKRWGEELEIPYFDKNDEIKYKKEDRKALSPREAIRKSLAIKRSGLVRGNSFRLVTYPSRSATMSDVKAYLYNLEHYDNFIPDVIVTDYADKFKAEDPRQQKRHQLSEIWESHKSLAQEKNCLVLTASQSNTARTGKVIQQGDWAEAIAKLELCDGGMAINMSPEDKKKGIMRAMVLKQRDDYFDLTQQVLVLHQLKIGKPYLDSRIAEQ